MLIVIEGCDATGKTTLAEKIASRIGAEVRHYGEPKRHPLEEYVGDLHEYRPASGKHIVIDRLHWGEVVYGPLYRGESLLGMTGVDWVTNALYPRGLVMVHAVASPDTIRARMRARGEDYLKDEHVEEVLTQMFQCAQQTRAYVPTMMYNSEPFEHMNPMQAEQTLQHAAEFVISWAQGAEEGSSMFNSWPQYLGTIKPEVLFCGDERNPSGPHYSDRIIQPFAPFGESSGRYLFTALGPWLNQGLGFINVNEFGLTADSFHDLCEVLENPPVVALGREAERTLRGFGVKARYVPHPQYRRRFEHNRLAEYRELLTKEMK